LHKRGVGLAGYVASLRLPWIARKYCLQDHDPDDQHEHGNTAQHAQQRAGFTKSEIRPETRAPAQHDADRTGTSS
jgi:hypothetical protein